MCVGLQDYPFARGASDFDVPLPQVALWRSQVDQFCIFRNLHETLPPKYSDGKVLPVWMLPAASDLAAYETRTALLWAQCFSVYAHEVQVPSLCCVCLLYLYRSRGSGANLSPVFFTLPCHAPAESNTELQKVRAAFRCFHEYSLRSVFRVP